MGFRSARSNSASILKISGSQESYVILKNITYPPYKDFVNVIYVGVIVNKRFRIHQLAPYSVTKADL
jgi:hypothetical protein